MEPTHATPRLRPILLALLGLFAAPLSAHADTSEGERTGAPYFLVRSPGAADALPLRESRAEATIAGVIAHVRVTQIWENHGSTPLEAVYVFPASTRAAVAAMRMKIGTRTIEAHIEARDAARKTYERAKEEGRSTSLLEEQRPNVFQMNVANIMPGDHIETILEYTELLVPEEGVYALVYPTVVGPRYVGAGGRRDEPKRAGAEGSESGERGSNDGAWAANPYLHEGEPAPYRWAMSVKIAAGLPVRDVSSPSHHISPRFEGPRTVRVETDEEHGGNRDFVLRYRLDGDQIETGLLLYPGAKESFFLLMAEPPARVEPTMIPPREYVFIVDVSGSMSGFPLETAKKTLVELLAGLRSQDRFNVLCFSGGSAALAEESVPATPENVERAKALLSGMNGGGATEIVPALKRALAMRRRGDMSTSFVVVTDGYVVVEKEVFSLIHEHLGTANLFAFGIGTSVNRALIEGMARAGMGQPFVVLGPSEAADAASKLRRAIESPVLTRASVRFEGFAAYDVEPASIPDVFASRPVIVFGKYRGAPTGRVTLTGSNGQGTFVRTLRVEDYAPSDDLVALRALWARDRIARLSDLATLDETEKGRDEVKRLGLAYGLLTSETSFVAVDSYVRNTGGRGVTVQQPLPLPEGVRDLAVSGVGGLAVKGHGAGGGGVGYGRGAAYGAAGGLGVLGTVGTGSGGSGSLDLGGNGGSGAVEGKLGAKSRPLASARVAAADVKVEGAMSPDVIQAVLRRNMARVRYCYERRLTTVPTLAGRFVLRLKIDAAGHVVLAELADDGVQDPELAACVLSVARSLVFPRSPASTIEVRYPFVFSPGP